MSLPRRHSTPVRVPAGVLVTAAVLIAVPATLGAQEPVDASELTFADSVALLVGALRAAADTGLVERDQRIWHRGVRGADGQWRAAFPSPELLSRLQADFPGVRIRPVNENLYECWDGGRPAYPLKTCPIRDEGIIIEFGDFRRVTPARARDVPEFEAGDLIVSISINSESVSYGWMGVFRPAGVGTFDLQMFMMTSIS